MYNRMSSPKKIYALREVGSQGAGTTNRELGSGQVKEATRLRRLRTATTAPSTVKTFQT
jgi:hypothetical protein